MPSLPSLHTVLESYRSSLDRLCLLYEKMDVAYNRLATQYGFDCDGCRENCCHTRFYNHTCLEFFYLSAGLNRLDPDTRCRVEERAATYCRLVSAGEQRGQTPREMCPLNMNGLCGMHEHRLMICRLHGIPYEFTSPGRARVHGEGCAVFSRRHDHQPYLTFDRTPFYSELAALEQEFRKNIKFNGKLKLTIAQMVLWAGQGDLP